MSRNDPDRLEAEAKELFEQMTKGKAGTPQPDTVAEDTPEEPEALQEEAPDPTDTAETIAEEDDNQEGVSGEPEDMSLALQKAEKAMKGAQSRMTKATQEAADLKRQNADLLKGLAELKAQIGEQQKDDGKLEQLRADYPDLASPLLDELKRTQDEVKAQREALAAQEQRKEDEITDRAAEAHFDRIKEEHSDVETIIDSADWLNWLEDQDYQTKQWIQAGSSNDVNNVLNKFKADMGVSQISPRERALEKAKSVAEPKMPKSQKPKLKGGTKSWSVDEIMRMPNEVFEQHQAEIMQSMAGGKIRR